MRQTTPILDSIEISSPCHASWEAMSGDERARHCRACSLTVFNISNMTRDEAEKLVREKEGRLCARFYRRPDGTILTADCGPVIKQRKRRQAAMIIAATASLFAAAFGADTIRDRAERQGSYDGNVGTERIVGPMRNLPVIGPLVNRAFPRPIITMGRMVMGDICVPSPVVPAPAPAPVRNQPVAMMGEVYVPPAMTVVEAPPVT